MSLVVELIGRQDLWEALAVILGITYLLLAVRENLWCWHAAFVSTGIYLVIFWRVGLLMESGLQLYYLFMAVYGWLQWRRGKGTETAPLSISSWSAQKHILAIAGVLLLSLASGFALQNYTSAALPFADSFTTWGSLLTTWMVARKILENWLYWLVIDAVSIALYIDRELYFTAGLFAAYLIIVIIGYFQWMKRYRDQFS